MKTTFIILLILSCQICHAQTRITGTIKGTDGKTIPAVNIYIKGTLDGSTSDSSGNYSIITSLKGNQILIASMIGMETCSIAVNLDEKQLLQNITLSVAINHLNAVTISAGNFETGDVQKTAVLSSLDIVTTAGATADIFSALKTLPGTLPSMEESGLFVRGGNANESKVFFDGILVNKAFTSDLPDISQRGRFSPFLFKSTSFSTGAYSAQYGGALSSTMLMDSKDLAAKTKSEIGIMSVGLNANHTQRFKNSSLELNTSYYNLNPVFHAVAQNTTWTHEPESGEGSLFYKQKTGKSGLLKVYASYEKSEVGLNTYNHDDISKTSAYDITSGNLYLNSSWADYFAEKWKVSAGAGYGNDKSLIAIDSSVAKLNDQSLHGRITVTRYVGKISDIKSGVDYQAVRSMELFDKRSHTVESPVTAGFIEGNLFLGNVFAIRPGIRYEHAGISDQHRIAPRFSLACKLNEVSQLSAGYGIFYQLPEKSYLFENNQVGFESASHYVLNYQYQFSKRTFRSELYYKIYNNLVKEKPDLSNSGYGYARGVDVFYRDSKTIKRAEYWLSYSFIDTKRNSREFTQAVTPSYVAKHVLNVVGKYFISKWNTSAGITYTFSSARNFYNPTNLNQVDKTPPYNNLSLNISYLTHLADKFTIIYLSVENIFGIKNIYGYRYSADGSFKKPILPSAPRSIFLGIFITFGDDNPLNI